METTDYNQIALKLSPLFNVLSHPARLQIMLHLAKFNGCQAGSISGKLPLAKSTVSEHLSKLKEAGLIICDADGSCLNYHINDEGFELVKASFNQFLDVLEQWKGKRTNCSPANSKSTLKCNRVFEICKTLPCFSDNCYPKN